MVNVSSPGPAPADHARANNSRLARSSWRTWPQRKLRRKVPQRVSVVGAVANGRRRGHQRKHLVVGVGPIRGISQTNVMVRQRPQSQAVGQGDRQQQSGIGHEAVVIKSDVDAIGAQVVASDRSSSFRMVFVVKSHYPRSREHFLIPSLHCQAHLSGGLRLRSV